MDSLRALHAQVLAGQPEGGVVTRQVARLQASCEG
jgi:hypothetical protein